MVKVKDGPTIVEFAVRRPPGHPGSALSEATFDAGALMESAVKAGVRHLVVAVGGTLSTDGGTGAARACGWRFLDKTGRDLPLGGGSLVDLVRIVAPADPYPASVIALCDVDVPLTGPGGCVRMFAPQKGATERDLELLEEGMHNLSECIAQQLGLDLSATPFAGAGGGSGAGLKAFFGAELRNGAAYVAERLGLREVIRRSALVLTGEGSLDRSTLEGKVPACVSRLALAEGVPCFCIAGSVSLDEEELRRSGFTGAVPLTEGHGSADLDAISAAARGVAEKGSLPA
jgi:glycerate kinase